MGGKVIMNWAFPASSRGVAFLISFFLFSINTAFLFSLFYLFKLTLVRFIVVSLFSSAILSSLTINFYRRKRQLGVPAHLLNALQSIEKGNFSTELDSANPEIGSEISEKFNAMAAKLLNEEKEWQNRFDVIERGKREWELIFDIIPDFILLLDDHLNIQRINRPTARHLGINPGEAIGKKISNIIPPESAGSYQSLHEKLLTDGVEQQVEINDPLFGGHLYLTLSPIFNDEGKIIGIIHAARNINELRKAEEEAFKARSFLQQIVDSVAETILVIGLDHSILLANKTARERFSLAHLEIEDYPKCFSATHGHKIPCSEEAAHICPLQEVAATRQPVSFIHEHFSGKDKKINEELTAAPLLNEQGEIFGIIEVGRDITEKILFEKERKRLYEKKVLDLKEKSIAALAGGIAHDFNNNLTVVLGNAELLKLRLRDDEICSKFSGQIVESVQKMSALTRQLLAYAKGGKYSSVELDLGKMIQQAVANQFTSNTDHITVNYQICDHPWTVRGDSAQLGQALESIINNSIEAMQKKGGNLAISLVNEKREDGWDCPQHQYHPGGDYVHLSFADTGVGIAPECISRVFDPFYSTKFLGRGLGLAAAFGIIRNHGGCLSIESVLGKGTTVHVYLPRMKGVQDNKREKLAPVGKKLLVVDDELPVLDFVSDGLRTRGYEVVTAINGFEALEIAHRQKDKIGLVLLDVQLPGMDGKEVYRQLKAVNSALPVILSSGYDEQTALAGLIMKEGDGFLQKPYTLKKLFDQVDNFISPAPVSDQ
jgi:two-component system cell cycle sensor histidine kinase/response regulator CckA